MGAHLGKVLLLPVDVMGEAARGARQVYKYQRLVGIPFSLKQKPQKMLPHSSKREAGKGGGGGGGGVPHSSKREAGKGRGVTTL